MTKSPKYYETLGRIKDGEMTIEYNCRKMNIAISEVFAKALADTKGEGVNKDTWTMPLNSIAPEVLQQLQNNLNAHLIRIINLKKQNQEIEAEMESLKTELTQHIHMYNTDVEEKIS